MGGSEPQSPRNNPPYFPVGIGNVKKRHWKSEVRGSFSRGRRRQGRGGCLHAIQDTGTRLLAVPLMAQVHATSSTWSNHRPQPAQQLLNTITTVCCPGCTVVGASSSMTSGQQKTSYSKCISSPAYLMNLNVLVYVVECIIVWITESEFKWGLMSGSHFTASPQSCLYDYTSD